MASTYAQDPASLKRWLMDITKLSDILHTPRGTISSWITRRHQTQFPDEWMQTSRGALWDGRDVIVWWVNWIPLVKAEDSKTGHIDPDLLTELGLEMPNNNNHRNPTHA